MPAPVPRARPRLTGRAAVLAVVACAIALSLAYPVREYIAQRRQIDQLQAQRQQALSQVEQLQAQQRQLNDPKYIEDQARSRLHYCKRNEKCYVIIDGGSRRPGIGLPQLPPAHRTPWYTMLWQSVERADHGTSR